MDLLKYLLVVITYSVAVSVGSVSGEFLRVQGNELFYGDDKVFLSGPNAPWVCYGCDFGNNQYDAVARAVLEDYVLRIAASGGNSIRMWIFVEGYAIPQWDEFGYPVATDAANTLISELGRFIDFAASHNVFVIPCLWNGALMRESTVINLIWDDTRLEAYLNNVLRPLVQGLKDKVGLAAWDIINEPDGSIKSEGHTNPCYDTSHVADGWSGAMIAQERMSKFISSQARVIHEEDPKALVTIGCGYVHASGAFGWYNFYSDQCMEESSGSPLGKLDFYQYHTYDWEGVFEDNSPFNRLYSDYGLTKPLVIGEFSSACGEFRPIENMFDHLYNSGYHGAWTWAYTDAGAGCSDALDVQERGFTQIRNYNHNGITGVTIR